MRGKYEIALDEFQQALDDYIHEYGSEDDPRLESTLSELAKTLFMLGRSEEGYLLLKRSLDLLKEGFPEGVYKRKLEEINEFLNSL